MTQTSCSWSLLSLGSLFFIYTAPSLVPYSSLNNDLNDPNDKANPFLGYSLFDLIHPDEVTLARRDLEKFMKTKSLGGSVTRQAFLFYSLSFYFSFHFGSGHTLLSVLFYPH
ncbi:hypothetical protein BDF14DRAFT_1860216 [Spinellus fusiger]|nr:hypothetical protein BDF14DRAFT_1860216 [Spinellus fusiger]